ncbi:hypothetical protein BGZ47_009897 [Haplosporangium gracile]|nr:hypothetical protein BGZ47_009897 [Haplosporangium gracile]
MATDGAKEEMITTTVDSTTTTTAGSLCETVVNTFKGVINTAFDTVTGLIDNALKDTGTVVSIAASILSQLKPITDLAPGVDGLIDTVLNVLSSVASADQDVATCMGAVKNCNGLLTILGYVLKADTIDKLIAGSSDAAISLKGIVDTISGFSPSLPSQAKLPLEILKEILDAVDSCNKGV